MVDITTPTVGGDDDAWGGILNTALTTLESAVTQAETDILGKVSKAGDTISGALNISNNGSGAPLVLSTTADGTASVGVLVINPFSAGKRAVDIRLSGDSVSRLRVDMSSGSGSGTLTFGDGTAADTNLYRGAANRLQTDDTFRIGTAALLEFGAAGDVNLYATGGNLQTDDYFVMPTGQASGKFNIFSGTADALDLGTAGGGVRIKEGSNARMGVATLVAGTVVVSNTSVTANTRIFLTCQTPGGTPGFLRVSARTASTSFTILSSSGTDTSVVGWLLVEPS